MNKLSPVNEGCERRFPLASTWPVTLVVAVLWVARGAAQDRRPERLTPDQYGFEYEYQYQELGQEASGLSRWRIRSDAEMKRTGQTPGMIESTVQEPRVLEQHRVLDSHGHVDPLYPWAPDFKKLGEAVTAREQLDLPPKTDNGLPLQGPSGLETAILLARRTPLPATADLAALISSLPPAPLRDPLEFTLLGGVPGSPVRTVNRGLHRGLGHEAKRIDEPLLHLWERLRPHFELFQAVRFTFQTD
jgi:hypothetical protein